MACVILKEGAELTEEELKDYVRTHMAKQKTPRYIDFVQEFPMNAAGKILKYKMREQAVEKLGLQAERPHCYRIRIPNKRRHGTFLRKRPGGFYMEFLISPRSCLKNPIGGLLES